MGGWGGGGGWTACFQLNPNCINLPFYTYIKWYGCDLDNQQIAFSIKRIQVKHAFSSCHLYRTLIMPSLTNPSTRFWCHFVMSIVESVFYSCTQNFKNATREEFYSWTICLHFVVCLQLLAIVSLFSIHFPWTPMYTRVGESNFMHIVIIF